VARRASRRAGAARCRTPAPRGRGYGALGLGLTRQQILAFRRRVGGLEARLPAGSESLERAAWAGRPAAHADEALAASAIRLDDAELARLERG